jgi:hypothetical protein
MLKEARSTSSEELSGQGVVVTGGSGFIAAHVVTNAVVGAGASGTLHEVVPPAVIVDNSRARGGLGLPSVSLEQGLVQVTGEWGERDGAGN